MTEGDKARKKVVIEQLAQCAREYESLIERNSRL